MPTPISMFEALRDEFTRYYDTPFRLRSANLMTERRNLIDQEGATWRQPWIEIMREYATTGDGLKSAVESAGGSPDLVEFIRCGLFQFDDLFIHQRDSLASILGNKNVVVSAGTGSGKTESFLLPVISALVEESRRWAPEPSRINPWWRGEGEFGPRRTTVKGRPQAIRTLILYPMNALVEDQLVRLRRALDSDAARKWLDDNRHGNRFFFGRYTGKTPVSGDPSNRNAVAKLQGQLRSIEARSARVAGDDRRFYLPRLDGAEMVSRWDMQAAAPDILITNYTMLNIMLLRLVENDIFDQTREWLEASEENIFHVVVDELHMYRGTAGTEVAYLLRSLLSRLGLTPDSPQVRFLATSASLGSEEESRKFLSQFFGAAASSFDLHSGSIVNVGSDCPENLSDIVQPLLDVMKSTEDEKPAAAAKLLLDARAREVLWKVTDGRTVALDDLGRRLFPQLNESTVPTNAEMMATLFDAIEKASSLESFETPRVRSHLFFRNVQGVWACTNPECSVAMEDYPDHYPDPDRRIGKLYLRPRHRCECGDRVLRLLYCQTCGDVFLGGYLAPPLQDGERMAGRTNHLLPELGELEGLPEAYQQGETCRNFAMFWPRSVNESDLGVSNKLWTRDGYTFEFKKAHLDSTTGEMKVGSRGFNGWTFEVSDRGKADSKIAQIPALPIRCPQCGVDNEFPARDRNGNSREVHDRSRTMSPIRGMSTGFEKFSQVLIDGMVRELRTIDDKARRLVLFSDSRQDAAKLSAGIEKRHYQHLNREVIVTSLLDMLSTDFDAAVRYAMEDDRSDAAQKAWRELRLRHKDIWELLVDARDDDATALSRALQKIEEAREGIAIPTLARVLEIEAASLGVPPAGSDYRVTMKAAKNLPTATWESLYEWPDKSTPGSARPTRRGGLDGLQDQLRTTIDEEVIVACVRNIFSGDGRDLETLALAKPSVRLRNPLTPPEGMDEPTFRHVVESCVRILGDGRHVQGFRGERDTPPSAMKRYLDKVAKLHGVASPVLLHCVEEAWGDSVIKFVIQPAKLILRLPGTRIGSARHVVDAISMTPPECVPHVPLCSPVRRCRP